MTADSPKALFMSATLHVAVVAVLLLVAFLSRPPEPMKVFEVVAGEGDNYTAREAPALGTPGVKVSVPTPPPPTPEPPVAKIEPAPVIPVPPPPKPEPKTITPAPKKVEPAPPDLAKRFKQEIRTAERNRKKQIEKEQAAEAKRAADEQKRITKEQFDRENKKTAQPPPKTAPPKIAKIDAEGIARGVAAGSPATKAGASGKALVSNTDDELRLYFAMLFARISNALEKPAGVDDELMTTIVFHISASGVLSRPRIKKASGSDEFDRAVMAAISRVTMPAKPDKKAEELEMSFRTKDVQAR
jgi:colicin import membrane protein